MITTAIMKSIYNLACANMAQALKRENISFSFTEDLLFGGGKFTFEEFPGADIVCRMGTYGADEGMFESYGFPWDAENEYDDVTGWLSIDEFIQKFKDARGV